jgi:hopene-associated glycosyltransferase HpnB
VVLVDDGSIDGTAEAARRATQGISHGEKRLHILAGADLPPGWSGKVWAMDQGVRLAESVAPQATYVLLTDADIEHDPSNVRILVAMAESQRLDLVSLMVRLHTAAWWDRLLIPAFVFFFQKLFPFAWVNNPARDVAAAAGGCILVRRDALQKAGGMESIRGHLIDDCSLARQIKQRGAIWLGLTTDVHSLRPYDGLPDIWRMVARTAFEQLHHSMWLVLLSVLGMAIVYLSPPVCVIVGLSMGDGAAAAMGGLAWLSMAIAYRPTLALYGERAWLAATLPLAGLLYSLMTVDSAWRSWRGRGGGWKGRAYPSTTADDGTASGV